MVTAYAYIEQRVARGIYRTARERLRVLSAGCDRARDVGHLIDHGACPAAFGFCGQFVGLRLVLDGERTVTLGVGAQVLHVHYVPSRGVGVEDIVGVGRNGYSSLAGGDVRNERIQGGDIAEDLNLLCGGNLQIHIRRTQPAEHVAGELAGELFAGSKGCVALQHGCRVAGGVDSRVECAGGVVRVSDAEGDLAIQVGYRCHIQFVPRRGACLLDKRVGQVDELGVQTVFAGVRVDQFCQKLVCPRGNQLYHHGVSACYLLGKTALQEFVYLLSVAQGNGFADHLGGDGAVVCDVGADGVGGSGGVAQGETRCGVH